MKLHLLARNDQFDFYNAEVDEIYLEKLKADKKVIIAKSHRYYWDDLAFYVLLDDKTDNVLFQGLRAKGMEADGCAPTPTPAQSLGVTHSSDRFWERSENF